LIVVSSFPSPRSNIFFLNHFEKEKGKFEIHHIIIGHTLFMHLSNQATNRSGLVFPLFDLPTISSLKMFQISLHDGKRGKRGVCVCVGGGEEH
jgi:hypothetical protein